MWKTDHLQFLLCVFIKRHSIESDIYNPANIKRHVEFCLCRYKLCCMCYALLCDSNFVRFADKEYLELEILACTLLPDKTNTFTLCDVTPKGYQFESISRHPDKLPDPQGPFPPKEQELPWYHLYRNCNYIPDCVDLYNDSKRYWTIKDVYGYENKLKDLYKSRGLTYPYYNFKRDDFLLAMGALFDYVIKRSDTWRIKCFTVKNFDNVGEEYKAFNDEMLYNESGIKGLQDNSEIHFTEMKAVLDFDEFKSYVGNFPKVQFDAKCKKLGLEVSEKHVIEKLLCDYKNDPATSGITYEVFNERRCYGSNYKYSNAVSACRFVFAKFETHNLNKVEGILFYTNTHYGDNLVIFDDTHKNKLKKCKEQCYNKVCEKQRQNPGLRLRGKEWIYFIYSICETCWNKMRQVTIDQMKDNNVFPYAKIGRLTLTYHKDWLSRINLEKCA